MTAQLKMRSGWMRAIASSTARGSVMSRSRCRSATAFVKASASAEPTSPPAPVISMIGGMSALIIVDIEVTDPVRYEDYKRLASASIAAHGGKYLVRGGRCEVLDGDWTPRR